MLSSLPAPSGTRKRIGKKQCRKCRLSWKLYTETEKEERRKIITVKLVIYFYRTGDAQCNGSPPPDWCLAVLVLSPPRSLCPPSPSHWQGSTRSWNILGSVQHRSATSKTSVGYQHCFSPKAILGEVKVEGSSKKSNTARQNSEGADCFSVSCWLLLHNGEFLLKYTSAHVTFQRVWVNK